jgi:hypothetical protein
MIPTNATDCLNMTVIGVKPLKSVLYSGGPIPPQMNLPLVIGIVTIVAILVMIICVSVVYLHGHPVKNKVDE